MPDNPIKRSFELTLTKLAALIPPRLPISPDAEDFVAVREHLEDIASIFDDHTRNVGREVCANSTTHIHISVFEGVVADALDGWTLPEITREIETLREERAA